MYPSLIGTFNISTPILTIISTPGSDSSHLSLVPFRTMYLDDPWTLPYPSASNEDARPTRMRMPLFVAEVSYQDTPDPTIDPGPSSSWMKEEDILALPAWVVASFFSHDCINGVFPSDEAIIEEINGP